MAKAIMVQGTTSSAGKSLLTAGLCRIFKQDGLRVAPFKSQNMALNSFITREGLEMGRAQVMQAQAAGIEPSVTMNPILLKPQSDTGSQVIVMGEVLGTMSAKAYFQYKKKLIPQILKAYEELNRSYDVIVLEGAGSPAEINLKADDIVNMGMAKMVGAPVLLVADIDRGGVFASLAGTMLLLEEGERAMVKGLVINKFRGDRSILEPGLTAIEELTGKPVTGVIPYLSVDLDDEDSLSGRFRPKGAEGLVEVAVIRLPRISNFTDFNPLESVSGLTLRYVGSVQELGNPDFLILPGTKSTIADLLWMRQNGLESAILKYAAAGGLVMGICGGYQMLGQWLEDPHGVEYTGGTVRAMGLLPQRTVFEPTKTRTRVSGRLEKLEGPFKELSHAAFEGYEIHMGKTLPTGEFSPLLTILDTLGEKGEQLDGCVCQNVCGCYIHGLFDSQETVRGLVSTLFRLKGLDSSAVTVNDLKEHQESQYDLLAEALRASLNMKFIYEILETGGAG